MTATEYQLPAGARRTAADVAAAAHLTGVAVVTGGSSGIGLATARALAAAGAHVVLGVRDRAQGEAAVAGIGAGRADVLELDLTDVGSVQRCAEQAVARYGEIAVLVANGGVSRTPAAHLPSGLDVRFATNHLGHFLLAHRLLPALGRGSRIVVVSSAAHRQRPVRFDDLNRHRRARNDLEAYGESKTANILFVLEAARRWAARGISANAVLPGATLSGLQRYHDDELMRSLGFLDEHGMPSPALKSVEQAAATSVWAATARELAGRGGLILEDCAVAEPAAPDRHRWWGYDPAVFDAPAASRLWECSREILSRLGSALPPESTPERNS